MGQQDPLGRTEEAQTTTGAVDWPWLGRRSIGPPYLHLRRHHGWQIEQTFKDVKEVWGAGQQQLRNVYANVGAFNLCGWMYSAVEAWAWEKPEAEVVDRRACPCDDPNRRASHADKRKALQRQVLRQGIDAALAGTPNPGTIRDLAERLLALAA